MPPPNKKKKPFDPFDESTYPNGEEPAQEDGPEVWPGALDTMLQKFAPANADNYTDCLTTQEIQTMLINHCGQAPTKPALVEDLTQRGYICEMHGSGLEWLLKKT